VTRHSNRSPLLAVAAVVLSLCASSWAFAGEANTRDLRDDKAYERFIVRFAKASPEQGDARARQRVLDGAGKPQGLHLGQLRRLGMGADVIHSDRKLNRAQAAALMQRLARDPSVAYVEADVLLQALGVPNDPGYPGQWNLNDPVSGINYAAATDLSTGSGTVVAVIDTGIAAHSELASPLMQVGIGYDFISDSNIAKDGDGRDDNEEDVGDGTFAGECSPSWPGADSSWHGTHVAGIVAAATNNGKGIAGVAPDAAILPLRVLGRCGGWESDVIDAIVWAAGLEVPGMRANLYPADVINLSLGGPGSCVTGSAMRTAITAAVAAGAVVVVAAGNDGALANGYTPATCVEAITVGAVGRTGRFASYSNWGPVLDLSAPGGDTSYDRYDGLIVSTSNQGTYDPYAESYASEQGTSMAAPHVSGTVALMQSARVNTPALVEAILKKTARPLPVACSTSLCGAGIIDAAAAVRAASTMPTLSVDDAAVLEGNSGTSPLNFVVSLSWPTNMPVTFMVSTGSGGSATPGNDFTAIAQAQYIIPAGGQSLTIPVSINGDTTNEGNEAFGFSLSAPTGATLADGYGLGTIVNDDVPALSISDTTITEGNSGTKTATFTVSLSRASTAAVTYSVFTTDEGTAKAATGDFVASTLAAETIPAGQLARTFSVTLNGDLTNEPDETLLVKLGTATNAGIADGTGVGTISNDDPLLWIDDFSWQEGNPTGSATPSATGSAYVTVRLSQAAAGPVACTAQTVDGTATAPGDYVARTTAVNFATGETSKIVPVTLMRDLAVEGDESLFVNLACSSLANATLADAQAMVTLLNDDAMPTLAFNRPSVLEGNGGTPAKLYLSMALSTPTDVPVTFNVATSNGTATAGSDYTALPSTSVTFAPGEFYEYVGVDVTGDATAEANEAFNFNITGLSGATTSTSTVLAHIVNDDGPTLSIADASITEGDSGYKALVFTVTLSQAAATATTYKFSTTSGGQAEDYVDYEPVPVYGVTTISAGTLSKTQKVTIYGDTDYEGDETVQVLISAPSAGVTVADGGATGTILNDDGPVVSISDAQMTELGNAVLTFNVSLSKPSSRPVSYYVDTAPGTAMPWDDYLERHQVLDTIPAGQTSKTFTVTMVTDVIHEGNETFKVNVSHVSGGVLGDGQGIGTIIDND
jgi:serine protease